MNRLSKLFSSRKRLAALAIILSSHTVASPLSSVQRTEVARNRNVSREMYWNCKGIVGAQYWPIWPIYAQATTDNSLSFS